MGEIEERLADAEATRRRLLAIKKTATEELAALESVRQVDQARRSLADLRRQARAGGETAESQAEMRRLESFIAEHSKQAEQAITAPLPGTGRWGVAGVFIHEGARRGTNRDFQRPLSGVCHSGRSEESKIPASLNLSYPNPSYWYPFSVPAPVDGRGGL